MSECASLCALACPGGEWAERRAKWGSTTAGRRDKSSSPVEPQAIGMAWVRPCRSVGARAAFDVFSNEFNGDSGTVRDFMSAEQLP